MAFAHLTLLIGGLLVAVPVVLHLTMRQQPKRLVFPALQFVRRRRDTNRRTLQLRQWLLLLLRCLAILAVALALARPSVASSTLGVWLVVGIVAGITLLLGSLLAAAVVAAKGRALIGGLGLATSIAAVALFGLLVRATTSGAETALGNQEAPVAAVLVFDSSPRMDYRQANKTRLQQAQQSALWLLTQLPADSEVAVIDARPGTAGFSVDLAAAKRTIERLRSSPLARTLPEVLDQALDVTQQSSLERKEIYLFSDLTEPAWPEQGSGRLAKRLEELPEVLLYVVDVGVQAPQDYRIGPLNLSSERLAQNGNLELETTLFHVGSGGSRTVELMLEQPDSQRPLLRDGQIELPTRVPRGRELCTLPADGSQQVRFQISGLAPGTHHGSIRIGGGDDGLAADDEQHFVVEVTPAWPVLVVAPEAVNTANFVEAVSPFEQRKAGQARFECTVLRPNDLANRALNEFQVVCLLDPPPLTPDTWSQLDRFVAQGGGLVIFLGFEASENVSSFQSEAALRLLPGRLERQWRTAGDVYLAPDSYDHPVLAEFRPIASQVPWNQFPVFRHWSFADLGSQARVILRYGNGQPALLESSRPSGRVLTMTTPITEPARPTGRQAWNELAGPDDWPRFVLLNETLLYLADAGAARLNYLVGSRVRLANGENQPARYQLFVPPDETREVTAHDGELTIRGTEQAGAYRLKGNRGGPVVRGFAVNLPESAGNLRRIEPERLDRLLGEQRFQLARERDEIERGVGRARVGYPFFPILMIVVVVLLGLENLLANRFYRPQSAAPPGSAATDSAPVPSSN